MVAEYAYKFERKSNAMAYTLCNNEQRLLHSEEIYVSSILTEVNLVI